MLGSHCCPIHFKRFVAGRGISLKFQAWIPNVGTLLFLNAMRCAQILYNDDWSISGDTIFHDLVSLSDRSRYDLMKRSHDCPDPVHDGCQS